MFSQFRAHYPKGSLLTELAAIDHGKYIVRCLVQDEGATLVTSLAAADTVELAEDKARSRALAILGISSTTSAGKTETLSATQELPTPLAPMPNTSKAFWSENLEQTQPTPIPETVRVHEANRASVLESQREEIAERIGATPLVTEELPFTDDEFSMPEVETSQDMETPVWMTEKVSSSQVDELPAPSPNLSEKDTSKMPSTEKVIDFSDIIARTNVELKRLGWTNQQGRDYLVQTYGKRSRQLLTDDELLDFLRHLESESTPE